MINARRRRFDTLHTHSLSLDDMERGVRLLSGADTDGEVVHVTVVPGLDA